MNEKHKNDSAAFGIVSLVLGILTLVFFCTCMNCIAGILAIIFGIIQLVQSEKKGLAIGGIITGAIGILLTILLYTALLLNTASYRSYDQIYEEVYPYHSFYDNFYED